MTVTIELTPQLEAKLRALAVEEGRDESEIALKAVEQYLESGARGPSAGTTGAQLLAEWEKEDILGLWMDRPEDSSELARGFRLQAEARGSDA